MKCDAPGCDNEATVHLTEIINGNISKLHLCEEHAKQKGAEMEQHFGIADLLQGLAEYTPTHMGAPSKRAKCPNCGMVYEDFKKVGRLGCADCYTTFKSSLTPLLKRIHGSNQYMGKNAPPLAKASSDVEAPHAGEGAGPLLKAKTPAAPQEDLAAIKAKLKDAIAREAYEEAAALRDKIRTLEKREK